MNGQIGSSHLTRAWLYGPAERTLIEPWLSEHAGLMSNAYPDGPIPDLTDLDARAATMIFDPQADPTPALAA